MQFELGFDVTDLGTTDHPTTGEQAPDFTRPLVLGEYWENVALSDLTDSSPVLLVFHPMIDSFPATFILHTIDDRNWQDDFDVLPVGLTISDPYSIRAMKVEWEISFPIFSDPGNRVAERFGVVHDLDGMNGVSEPRPAVFLLDEHRGIEYAWVADQWPQLLEYDAIEETIATRASGD